MPGEGCSLSDVGKGGKIVRCCLVYKIVQQLENSRLQGRANGKGFPVLGHRFENNAVEFQWEVFCLHLENIRRQGFPVVFRMTGNEKLAARFAGDQIGAGFLRRCQKRQLRAGKNVLVADCCMAGMGGKEKFVKTAHQRMLWLQRSMFKHAEHLLRQRIFGNPIMMIERRLGAPTDVKCRINVGFRPIHKSAQFRPVIHFLKWHLFHRAPVM